MKKRDHADRHFSGVGNGSFLKNLDHMIEEIEAKLAATTSSRQLIERDVRAIEEGINASITETVDKALPDIEPRTIALLKRDYPTFLSRELTAAIAKARTVRAPFWTWVVGDGKTYRNNEKNKVIGQVKVKLRGHIEATRPTNNRMTNRFNEKSAEVRRLALLEQELSTQLQKLQKARRVYGADDAPQPDPDFRSAVRESSGRLRNDYDRSSSTDTFWRDIYISDQILDAIREQRRVEEARHRHDDDATVWNTPSRHGGSGWPTTTDDERPIGRSYPSQREDRGGGMEVDTGGTRAERGGGFEVNLGGRGTEDRGGGFAVSMKGDDSRGALS